VTVTDGNQTVQWNFRPLNGAPPRIVQRHTQATAGGHVCQRVLSAVSHVVTDVQACALNITDQASRIADQMAARMTP
jgi:hypothetical protein